jgi:hypothetical protein
LGDDPKKSTQFDICLYGSTVKDRNIHHLHTQLDSCEKIELFSPPQVPPKIEVPGSVPKAGAFPSEKLQQNQRNFLFQKEASGYGSLIQGLI